MPGALNNYLARTERLLNDVTSAIYSPTDLTSYINEARPQVAADTESLRQPAFVQTVFGQRPYKWSEATFIADPVLPPGLGGVLSVRSISRSLIDTGGLVPMFSRAWEWFSFYYMQQAVPTYGYPTRWSVLQPGISGVFYVDPIPDDVYILVLDPICFPAPLIDNDSDEALQYPWTDAVPYYSAYLALLNTQRFSDADAMFAKYRLFARRGTQMTTPSQLPMNYPGGEGAKISTTKTLIGGPADPQQR